MIDAILARKRREVERRMRHHRIFDPGDVTMSEDRGPGALAALRRPKGSPIRVIAELKFASPSEGAIRPWSAGAGTHIASAYTRAGASAVSVLADRAGFAGSVLEVRRVARSIDRPVLFKEFVVDAEQIELARVTGAAMVLLLVRALGEDELERFVRFCRERGLEAVVEAANERELEQALSTDARIIGINARDLATFRVDPALAARAVQKIPESRVAVYMSGVSTPEELERVSKGRADAVLIGTALMRATDPAARLAELLTVPK